MPRYHFHIRNGWDDVADTEGLELADLAAARDYANATARELLFRCEARRRHWIVEVCDDAGSLPFELAFIDVDDSIRDASPETMRLLRKSCVRRLALAEAMFEARMAILNARATVARARSRPYLVASSGRRIAA